MNFLNFFRLSCYRLLLFYSNKGNINGCGGPKCGQQAGGYAFGQKMEDFKFLHKIKVTQWKIGQVVEVAWAIRANHGGGYSYRLCKMPEGGRPALTEECFQVSIFITTL